MKKIFALALLAMSTLCSAETAYIQSSQAKVYAEPRFDAAIIATLTKGAQVDTLQNRSRWQRISTGSVQGWVSTFLLAATPPLDKVSVLGDDNPQLANNARRRASAVTTAGAARGLTETDRRRISDSGMNYVALDRLEKTTPSDSEVSHFIEEGLK
jgi:hypothetical protein